ncbi:uncharacterized protein KRP23_4070 [Phytophthora ramorum]|uniref:uncharacterized protein n=1 Tax=Phytophthora ramorum TaxID=164328 RepID=UPI0030954318|nr:hypothetical protein KRP23_4070 [Phytophthora ramorum]
MPTREHNEASVLHRMAASGTGKSEYPFPDRGLLFPSRFDGGIMTNVQLMPSGAFSIKVAEDAATFGPPTGYSTWFYFEEERGGAGIQSNCRIYTWFQSESVAGAVQERLHRHVQLGWMMATWKHHYVFSSYME